MTAGFDFGPPVDTTRRYGISIPRSDGSGVDLYIASAPPVALDNNTGAAMWVNCFRGMVEDWCAEHRRERLLAENAA